MLISKKSNILLFFVYNINRDGYIFLFCEKNADKLKRRESPGVRSHENTSFIWFLLESSKDIHTK